MFRAVREDWNKGSDVFVDPDVFTALLDGIADAVNCAIWTREYGDVTSVGFLDGAAVLDYIEQTLSPDVARELLAEAEEDVAPDDLSDLIALVSNMQALAPVWRSSIGEGGELVFYVD